MICYFTNLPLILFWHMILVTTLLARQPPPHDKYTSYMKCTLYIGHFYNPPLIASVYVHWILARNYERTCSKGASLLKWLGIPQLYSRCEQKSYSIIFFSFSSENHFSTGDLFRQLVWFNEQDFLGNILCIAWQFCVHMYALTWTMNLYIHKYKN